MSLLLVGGLAAVATLLLDEDEEPAFAADLARLRSVDDLYTAPQIRQQAGYSLADTAFARAVLRRLRQDMPALTATARARLTPAPGEPAAKQALATALLALERDGGASRTRDPAPAPKTTAAPPGSVDDVGAPAGAAGVAALGRARVRALWRAALSERDGAAALRSLADLVEAAAPDAPTGGRAPAPGGARLPALLRRTAASAEPATARDRARVVRALGLRPDAAMRRIARRDMPRSTTNEDRVLEAASILESAAAAGLPARGAVADALVDAALQLEDPEAIWVALGALRAARLPAGALRDRVPILRRSLGSHGAVREIAIFETIPKAVWLAAHLRLEAGAEALPEGDTVALSRVIARRDELTDDADDRALLFASARLSGLSYDDAALSRAPVPAAAIGSTRQAVAWSQRARVASDLGTRPASVTVAPWELREDVDVAALGLVLDTAALLGIRAVLPAGTADAFSRAAGATTFRSSRWALWTAAGLVATKAKGAAATALRGVRVGCRGFPHLVAEIGDTGDLEATWFVLRLAEAGVPGTERLRAQIVGKAP